MMRTVGNVLTALLALILFGMVCVGVVYALDDFKTITDGI